MQKTVIIVAGGKGLRMGGDLPKQFLPLQGQPVLMHTITMFYQWDSTVDLIIVLPEKHVAYWKMLSKELNFKIPHRAVSGGETRFHSVQHGLDAVHDISRLCEYANQSGTEEVAKKLIAIHDGVRPLVSPEVITACFKTAETYGTAIPVIPIMESIREINGDESRPFDRSRLCVVQTPQVFHADILIGAYNQPYNAQFTDDASVVEATGHKIHLVNGNIENIKITTPFDLQYAEYFI